MFKEKMLKSHTKEATLTYEQCGRESFFYNFYGIYHGFFN